jgi:hypothetical protein
MKNFHECDKMAQLGQVDAVIMANDLHFFRKNKQIARIAPLK